MPALESLSRFPFAFDHTETATKPAKPFLIGPDSGPDSGSNPGTLTYATLFERIRRLATFFHAAGLHTGDRVILASRDDAQAITLFLAMLRCGITAVILDPQSPPEECRALIRAADPRGVILDADLAARVDPRRTLPDDTVMVTLEPETVGPAALLGRLFRRRNGQVGNWRYPALLHHHAPMRDLPADLPDRTVAYLLFTSGTTASPKGVEITHRNLFAHMVTLVRQYGYEPATRILNSLPLHHTDGLNQGATVALVAGATLFRPGPFTIQTLPTVADWIHRFRITHFVTVPTVLALIERLSGSDARLFDTADFRFIVSLAGYLDEGLWRRFEERFRVRIVNVYGLTETVSGSLYCGPDDDTRRIGTVGKPVDCACRIVDDDGCDVAPGRMGELLLRGDHVMPGYFRAPEATAAVIRNGWLHTGDLATADDDGFYAIVGRKKNVIITGGINVYPERVTSVLKSHPDVVDAATFGMPDAIWGERVVACVQIAPGRAVTPQALVDHCRARIAPESVPAAIHVLDVFPRGPAGKAIINRLRERVAAAEAAPAGPPGREDITVQVYALAARCFRSPTASLCPHSSPDNTAGWDSYAHLEFATALEEHFGIKLAPKDIMNMQSLDHVERLLHQKLAP